MAEHKKSDATYIVPDSERERVRLQRQADILNPFTRRLFISAGLVEGMRVLDIGSGAGDVAFLARELIGESGQVVGIDKNPAVLETARRRAAESNYKNVHFLDGDARSITIDGQFDAIVGRAVLVYLKDPIEALSHVRKFLTSNGRMAFLEFDLSSGFISMPLSPMLQQLKEWLLETCRRAGVELQMGLKLRKVLLDAGCHEPMMQFDAIIGGGASWSAYEYLEETFRSMLPIMEQLGIATTEEVAVDTLAARLRQELTETDNAAVISTWIGAWGKIR